MNNKVALNSFSRLCAYCEAEDYRGWAPYDGLNSKVFQVLPGLKKSALCRGGMPEYGTAEPSIINTWSAQEQYLLSYIHPRDLDRDQPVLKKLPPSRIFKSYVGVKGAERKLHKYLSDFEFSDIQTADTLIDWHNVKEIDI